MTRHLAPVPGPPSYRLHHGAPVEWEPWRHTPEITHNNVPCAHCGAHGEPWSCWGILHPTPAHRFDPATPTRSLVAFLCPRCHHQDLYWVADDFSQFVPIDNEG